MEIMLRVKENQDIERLLTLAHRKHKEGDYQGEMKVASVLSSKYGIEGEHSFAIGEPQE